MADRLTVRLEWTADRFSSRYFIKNLGVCGPVGRIDKYALGWRGQIMTEPGTVSWVSEHHTSRSAAMRAVEEAVMRALEADASATGAEGGGDG